MLKNAGKIVSTLKKEYGIEFFRGKTTPFKVLISCILSLRTKDEVTYNSARKLFKLAKNPKEMLKLSKEKIAKTIYPVGFYKKKAETILKVSKQIIERYGSKVPSKMEELLKLNGVGRKTANVVLLYGFKKNALPIDTHCHRIANRIGWVKTKTPEETEKELRKILPKKYWREINELFVKHGQKICRPISPICSKCKIRKYCKRKGVKKSR